jgi:hypothetical protein
LSDPGTTPARIAPFHLDNSGYHFLGGSLRPRFRRRFGREE